MDKVRVILTNDNCHTDLVPDVIARRIDEKIKLISGVDLNDYYTKTEGEKNDRKKLQNRNRR